MRTLRALSLFALITSPLACAEDAAPAPEIAGEIAQEARAHVSSPGLLVAIEGGGAVELDPRTGAVRQRYNTGPNAFGAYYSPDGTRAFVTDKGAGTLLEIDLASSAVLSTLTLGVNPQQGAIAADGRLFIPMSGDASIAVVDVTATPRLLRSIPTGTGSKPHIVSLSPDGATLWATLQGIDPRVISIAITAQGEDAPRDTRYDIVPRVVFATDQGALFTGHHSTGLHAVNLESGAASTPFMDIHGDASEARKQIEGVTAPADGSRALITHEGRRAVVVLERQADGKYAAVADIDGLASSPYWVSLDGSGTVFYVSIPGSGLVEAYGVDGTKLWSSAVGGKPKRLAVRPGQLPPSYKAINFGVTEFMQGRLNSADGTLPAPGETVILRAYVEAISRRLCGSYCMALTPRIWVRFNGNSAFQELTGVPQGQYAQRGPVASWSSPVGEMTLNIPATADRIELYAHYGRISWNGGTCYLGYDVSECPDSFPIDGTWVSNLGRNFRIDVRR